MNNVKSKKYGFLPEEVESRSLLGETFRMKHDFLKLLRVEKDADRDKNMK